MKFPKEMLQELVWNGEHGGTIVLQDELVGNSRWSLDYILVFKIPDGRIFGVNYGRGATEQQDEQPFQYENDEVECRQFMPVEKTITIYVPVAP